MVVEGFKGKKIPQIHANEHLLDDICFHKSIPFFSGTSSTTRKHNRNLEPFFRPRDFTLQLYIRDQGRELVQHHDVYAPINVKPAGEGRQGMGWVFDIFQKFAVKFPAHGHIIPVKCNQISPLRAAHCAVKYPKAGRKKRTIKIFPNKTLKSLFILRCSITKDTCSCYSCNYTF